MSINIFNVSAVSGAYVVNGINNPPINMYRGKTYTFNINASGHPFFIQTTTPYNADNVYSNGVTGNGTQNGSLTFIVPLDAPNTLYYLCQFHSTMGNQITITNEPIVCYSKGTLILTDQGYSKIEDIKKGDIIIREGRILQNGTMDINIDINTKKIPVIWVGSFTPKILDSKSRPICIKKNAFGKDYPIEDLYVSPGHRVIISNKIVHSGNLINGKTIYQDNECKSIEYYHLECEEHSAIYANGVLSETYIDCDNREIFDTK